MLRSWRNHFRPVQLSALSKKLMCIVTIMSMMLMTSKASAENLIRFDINKQRADQALIAFAQKANQTIIFSFDLTKKYQANSLKGFHSVHLGIQKLLKDTGLIAIVNNSGQLSIQVDEHDREITTIENKTMKAIPVPIILGAANQTSLAQVTEQEVEKISIIGSRFAGRSADDLPVPVDILSAEALANTGQTEVGRMLQAIAPSFNFSSSSISDGTDALRPATLRGLGPDQTLILINGKRRHQASLIHINTSVGRGTAGTDMNAIPASSI